MINGFDLTRKNFRNSFNLKNKKSKVFEINAYSTDVTC